MQTPPANQAQLNVLEHLKKRLKHLHNFYFAGALLDTANLLIREKLSKLSEDTNAYQLYCTIQPVEVLYFRAAVSKTCISHITTWQTLTEE